MLSFSTYAPVLTAALLLGSTAAMAVTQADGPPPPPMASGAMAPPPGPMGPGPVTPPPGPMGPTVLPMHHHDLAKRFEAANTTHDGRLTFAQAKAAHMRGVVHAFNQIDATHRGYVTLDDLRAWHHDRYMAAHVPPPPPPVAPPAG